MPKVLVDIPEQLMSDALEVSGPNATKAGTVREALALLVATHRSAGDRGLSRLSCT